MNTPKSTILVPFASDGSCFNPSLRCPISGKYTVGESGKESAYDDFEDALEHIKMMYKARWRRPNEDGEWEVVSVEKWELMPKDY
jgi:hypothetical protein